MWQVEPVSRWIVGYRGREKGGKKLSLVGKAAVESLTRGMVPVQWERSLCACARACVCRGGEISF